MNIAVTGATGFVGRHVLQVLTERSMRATAVCRPGSGLPPWVSAHDVKMLDIADPAADCFALLGRPDILIHLAWDGLPNYRSPHHFEVELPAQYAFLKMLINSGLRTLVVSGTCFEYGMRSGPLSESLTPEPTNPYSYAKDALRRHLEFLRSTQPFNLIWARLFYLYGEGQASTSLVPKLEQAVAQGVEAFDMSGGEQLRDYLHVREAAQAIVELAIRGRHTGPVNVCSGVPVSVRRFVEEQIQQRGWSIKLNLGAYPYADYEPFAFWGTREELDRWLNES